MRLDAELVCKLHLELRISIMEIKIADEGLHCVILQEVVSSSEHIDTHQCPVGYRDTFTGLKIFSRNSVHLCFTMREKV